MHIECIFHFNSAEYVQRKVRKSVASGFIFRGFIMVVYHRFFKGPIFKMQGLFTINQKSNL